VEYEMHILLFAFECNCTQSLSKKTFFINQQTSNWCSIEDKLNQ
jgi:hypothetical protein